MTLEEKITRLLQREGGYVNNPADAGGPTNHGITQGKLSDWLKRPATIADVESLTEATARAIYGHDFRMMGLDVAPDEVEDLLLDILQNHGAGNGVKMLQRALISIDRWMGGAGRTVVADGQLGPKTRRALAEADGPKLYRYLVAERMRFTGRVITKNLKDDDRDGIPDNTEFAEGWLNRQADFVEDTP